VVFAPLFPIALGVISWFLADLLAPQAIAEFSDFETVATFFVVPAGIYAAVMYLGGCYRFAGLECRESVAREWELAWLRGLRLRSRPQADDARAGFWRNAIAKELRLQKLNLMLALIFGAACLMLAGYHRLQPPGEDLMVYRIPLTLYWFIAPITLGAITFAEERQLGQFEWQLTLPPARWKLWLVKATLTLLLALLLLVGLPLAVMAWLYAPLGIAVFDTWGQTVCACGAVLLGTTLAVFISSLSATTIKAVMCTLGTLGVAALGIPPINFILRGINHGPIEDLYSAFTQYLPATTYLAVYLLLAGSIVTPFALTLGLSMRNYLAGEVRQSWAWVQWAVVVASLSFFCGLIFVLLQFLAKT